MSKGNLIKSLKIACAGVPEPRSSRYREPRSLAFRLDSLLEEENKDYKDLPINHDKNECVVISKEHQQHTGR
jgi:hypothetical protein